MDMGNVGDSNTTIRLYCELIGRGWTLIRRGWRKGLSKDKNPTWVFCPLLKSPRDRKLIEDCKKCKHYKGVSHSTARIEQKPEEKSFKFNIIPARKKIEKKKLPEVDLEKDIEKQNKKDKEWEEEERRIFGREKNEREKEN